MDSGKPYIDTSIDSRKTIREFSDDIDPIELMWHRDLEDRQVTILEVGKGWKFQEDDNLPLEIQKEDIIFIPKLKWHRVIKGEGMLKIQIDI